MPRLYRTCFINSNLEVTYLCLALIEVIKFKNKNEVRTAIRKHHFDRALVGGECSICEVLWDLVVEYKVRHRLVRTFWEAAEMRTVSPAQRQALKNAALETRKRDKFPSISSFITKVPKEKYMPVIVAAHT